MVEMGEAAEYGMVSKMREMVSRMFYNYGLFCSNYPIALIVFSVVIAVLCSLPCFFAVPLTLTAPYQYTTPLKGFPDTARKFYTKQLPDNKTAIDHSKRPQWFSRPPVGYVLQVVINASVSPWQPGLTYGDDVRGPLSKAFELDKEIKSFSSKSNVLLRSSCLYVSDVADHVKGVMPEHSCLVVSPANVWQGSFDRFQEDPYPGRSVFMGNFYDKPALHDLLLGVQAKYTGLQKYNIHSVSPQISFAVTVVFHTYNDSFIEELKSHLEERFNMGSPSLDWNTGEFLILHIYYKSLINSDDFMPAAIIYALLMFYIYFSVRKIEMVKSKWGLALSATVMLVLSCTMSAGLCIQYGVEPTLNEGEVFPYIIILIGLENILVLIKSVTSTPMDLPVELRIAQGLSKEGWSISKNMWTEILIVVIGLFTFVSAVQEFCLLALVAMFSDFFLQMMFFVSILALDFRRLEISDLYKSGMMQTLQDSPDGARPSRTHHRSFLSPFWGQPIEEPAPTPRIPRRLRVFNFLASIRIIQKIIKFTLALWIIVTCLFIYKAGIINFFLVSNIYGSPLEPSTTHSAPTPLDPTLPLVPPLNDPYHTLDKTGQVPDPDASDKVNDPSLPVLKAGDSPKASDQKGDDKVKDKTKSGSDGSDGSLLDLKPCHGSDCSDKLSLWVRQRGLWKLSAWHWPALFNMYNISLADRYVSILPPIKLNIHISPEEAVALRKDSETKRYGSSPGVGQIIGSYEGLHEADRWDYYVTMMLGIISGASSVILMMLLCKCATLVRSRQARYKPGRRADIVKRVQGPCEAVPLHLTGHEQEVECFVTGGRWVVSACIQGDIRIWDPNEGRCEHFIPRTRYRLNNKSSSLPRQPISPTQPLKTPNHSSVPSSPFSPLYTDPPQTTEGAAPNSARDLNTHFCSEVIMPRPGSSKDLSSHFSGSHEAGIPRPGSSKDLSSHFCASQEGGMPRPGSSKDLAGMHFSMDGYYANGEQVYSAARHPSQSSSRSSGVASCDDDPYLQQHTKSRTHSTVSADFSQVDMFGSPQEREGVVDPAGVGGGHCAPHGGGGGDGAGVCSTVWCLACKDELVAAGCSDGSVELWSSENGQLLAWSPYKGDQSQPGITGVCFCRNLLVVARLGGSLDFLQISGFNGVGVTVSYDSYYQYPPVVHLTLLKTVQAHQQPINTIQANEAQLITASQDYTLKVYSLDDLSCRFTLRGHAGSVTSLYVDKDPFISMASGSTDGLVRLWDTSRGDMLKALKGPTSTVLSITCTSQHVLCVSLDNKLCVWTRLQGWMLHVIQLDGGCSSSVATLNDKLMITGAQGYLVVWDIVSGEPIRELNLGDKHVRVKNILPVDNSPTIVCDFGSELRLIQFPPSLEKID
ncbi:sterol regulatory element-binding protein cleavage-activating protein isoform X1 [Strongylocentrotus purpuratus]|uniref:Sterol regulatory element-binding protein cleavage-activating protein n=1 Tax=Strongylocentrotus purpuratus TaxID=7668 RepID=A0A7M7P8I5_STRPU|nr:sterol regulatory element-binding protein cleavage-activating protein isoform X1 [Strongylocentrotus purpuratus]